MAALSSLALPHLDPMSDSSPEAPLERLKKKRRRLALTCEQCRRRKIRCDGNAPCNNCTKLKMATVTGGQGRLS
ncbi:hypothetical protein BGZ61DRAFT_469783 [Ilyonectria robusta]|uniref:uncharacterized protein n=1 Tax=Ilyonectria robusta TaxID=1079257 RepID=UPI001E8EE16D|nr:uncharacterized protein BGZ61DRAFT_469783 [Ilyonectria robusta]KAH8648229.1 hypothetical protein BGZ61DRAFT_469783 [Ilyonectria robusta]